MPEDFFDLNRFVAAQNAGSTYQQALDELFRGRKVSHWMWFVFPQLAGLGRSATAQRYAITSLVEAQAYVDHAVLGPRLLECATAVSRHGDDTATSIFGAIDAVKLRSSMTLFARADPGKPIFPHVLELFFDGEPDSATDELLGRSWGR